MMLSRYDFSVYDFVGADVALRRLRDKVRRHENCNCNLVVLVALAPKAAWCDDAAPTRVTVDNFCRAETDSYFAKFVREGALGKIQHERELTPIEKQNVIRLNRDTLYSFGVFDLEAGPVTVTLPGVGKRFMSLQAINQDHFALDVLYAPGTHSFSNGDVGTRYVAMVLRTFVNPNDSADIEEVHKLQDAIKVEQPGGPGKFEIPAWDQQSLTKMREALLGVVAA